MIKTSNNAEKMYRAINMDSSSSLKQFVKDRKKYYKKYILKEYVEDEESKAITMGRIVETKLLEPELFDDRFIASICIDAPTGLMLSFVDSLFKHTISNRDENDNLTVPFDSLLKIAYEESGYKISFDRVVNSFTNSEAQTYFEEKLQVYKKNLTVVSITDVANADKIVDQIRTNPFTQVVNLTNSVRYSITNQHQVTGLEYNGLILKGMFDKVVIDHVEKTIQVYDLKCTWAVENFYKDYYIANLGYIQSGIYHLLASKEFSDLIEEGYVLNPIKYIVCDSIGYYNPLIYTLNHEDLKECFDGFEYRNVQYPGINKIVDNLNFAKEMDIWNISKDNYINFGIVNLK
jgi:hypothetical protein